MQYHLKKILLDYFLVALLVIPALILTLLFALMVFLKFRENPFFFQYRGITFENRYFKMLKIKTIKNINADKPNDLNHPFLLPSLQNSFSTLTSLLRRTGFDELPQIIHVITGKMSFIGPRPLMPSDVQFMKAKHQNEYKQRESFKSKPGITGTWQLFGSRNMGIENLIFLERYYEINKSLRLDLQLLLLTLIVIVFAKNSDSSDAKINFYNRLFSLPGSSFLFGKIISLYQSITNSQNEYYKLLLPQDWWVQTNSVENTKANDQLSIIKFSKENKKGNAAS